MSRLPKLYIGTNTKMYQTIADTVDFLTELGRNTRDISRDCMELFVIPSFTALDRVAPIARQHKITLGAQNMCWEDQGQFTGEISPLMLREVGVGMVEIGHSERRHCFGETDDMQNKKVLCALRHGFTALLCIGETGPQKERGTADEVLRMQLKNGLAGVAPSQAGGVWIAYEPVWAIGESGVPATKEYAAQRHQVIREALIELWGEEAGGGVPVLYGGSVNGQNATELIRMPCIDGLFIGRSAWDPDNFAQIIRAVLREGAYCHS